ncbi:MAG: hypothetical protein B0D88_09295, partial [Candidatus Sedimenticola endophacoides]
GDETPGVIAANHASYIDGLALTAALPGPLCFVVKDELRTNPVLRPLLQRLGCEFVSRGDKRAVAADVERLKRRAAAGETLLFFPEGTFVAQPGLLPFRMGAFVTAAMGQLPLTPVTVNGSRAILPAEHWSPRRGRLLIVVGEPLRATSADWQGAVELRGRCREMIQTALEE